MLKRVEKIKMFCGYDQVDEKFVDEFKTHISPLISSDQIDIWFEGSVLGGEYKQQEIENHLKEANIALLLVSPDFLKSHFSQIKQAMDLYKEGRLASVIPILIRPSLWKFSLLHPLKLLPKNEEAISLSTNRDRVFVEVLEEIIKGVERVRSTPQQSSNVREEFLFVGLSATNGYRWDTDLRPSPNLILELNIPDTPWLVSQPANTLELAKRYSIFNEPQILSTFANLSPTADAIQQFANQYGHLAGDDLIQIHYPEGKPDTMLWLGESLQFWVKEIRDMHMLVTLWEMVKNRQLEALRGHIHWKLDPLCVYFQWIFPHISVPKQFLIASKEILPEIFYQWNWGEVIRPTLHYLCDQIEEHLRGHINPTLFLSPKRGIYMVPDGLRSALYLLLLMEIEQYASEFEEL